MTDYGTDFAQSEGDFLTGFTDRSGRTLILEDLARALEMDEGFLGQILPEGYPWDKTMASRGYNLRRLVNAKVRDFVAVARRIEQEARKDDRVIGAVVEYSRSESDAIIFKARIEDDTGEFPFTIKASELTVETFFEGRQI